MTARSPRDLASLVREELSAAAPAVCAEWVDEIRRRYGASLAAVLFYGSCLRSPHTDGVLDFYAIVDDYPAAYDSRLLALANAVLPPNVFYLEREGRRAKVAVLSARDFARAVTPAAIRPAIWARFCQPFAIAWSRDEAAREAVACTAAAAIRTAVERGLGRLSEPPESPEAFWYALFRETYRSELRTEQEHSVRALYASAPERYDRVLEVALRELPPVETLLARPRNGRRVLAKTIGAAQLLKSAVTFGDWMPYALWKLERHTGSRLDPTERQRRHPFLFAWPLVFRALVRRELR